MLLTACLAGLGTNTGDSGLLPPGWPNGTWWEYLDGISSQHGSGLPRVWDWCAYDERWRVGDHARCLFGTYDQRYGSCGGAYSCWTPAVKDETGESDSVFGRAVGLLARQRGALCRVWDEDRSQTVSGRTAPCVLWEIVPSGHEASSGKGWLSVYLFRLSRIALPAIVSSGCRPVADRQPPL